MNPPCTFTTDPEDLNTYGRDWTKHLVPKPSAIAFPTTTAEVVALVQWAIKNNIYLVPSGGRTGLSGAAFATQGEVVVSFEKMNRILNFDESDMTVTCEPGVVTESLQHFAEEKGYYFPVDFASRGSSHIGGNIATNAGGIKVVRYGLMRPWVSDLEVVTGRGDVLHLGKSLIKNATGYDLRQLFIGSEGTLGFITQAKILLTKKPATPQVLLLALSDLSSVMKIYHLFRKSVGVTAFEMLTDRALKIVVQQAKLNTPFQEAHPYYLVLEIEGGFEDKTLELFETALGDELISDGLLAQSPAQAREFWRYREDISEATSAFAPYKNDISVRISKVPQFLDQVNDALNKNYPDLEVIWFGHVGDGNLHINILKPSDMTSADFLNRCHEVDEILFSIVDQFEGSVSAEHGVGLTKKKYLHHTRSPEEIAIMREIKKIFDPAGIINPGKIFDP